APGIGLDEHTQPLAGAGTRLQGECQREEEEYGRELAHGCRGPACPPRAPPGESVLCPGRPGSPWPAASCLTCRPFYGQSRARRSPGPWPHCTLLTPGP